MREFADARKYIPSNSEKRRIEPEPGIQVLDRLSRLIEVIDRTVDEEFEVSARERMIARDENDWPIVATSQLLKCPVWTEGRDFFGSGISTWTTETVDLYLRA